MKTDSDFWSCAPFMTCTLQTPSSAPSFNTRFPGDTHAQSAGINWIYSWSGVFSTHALTTVRTAIQITPWCAVRSGRNRRNSIAQRQKGSLVSMSARYLNQTSWSSSLRLLKGNLDPCNLVTLPQRCGKLRSDTMYRTALAPIEKRSSKPHDWFEANSTVIIPVIEAKRAAFAEYKRTPSERNLQILRIARSRAQQTARRCANEYWTSSLPP